MNPKALIPLIGGLGVAGLAGKFGWDYIQKAQAKPANLVTLWAVTQEVARGVAIDESMLTPVRFPPDAIPADALADKAKIVGRVPHTGCPAGLPILDNMLLPPGTKAGMYVPPGMRAVAVKVDEGSGVDFHLRPGDHVDVIGFFQVRANGRDETIARTLIENVEIGAVGPQIASDKPAKADSKDAKSAESKYDKPPRAITLYVPPAAVPQLHLAEQRGKLKLAMRNDDDSTKDTDRKTTEESELLGLASNKKAPETGPMPAGWQEQVSHMMETFFQEKSARAAAQPSESGPEVESAPTNYAWQMTVYNGAEKLRLAWKDAKSGQPIDITGETPNVFQDKPRGHKPVPPKAPPASADDPKNEPKDTKNGAEPQELFHDNR